MSRCHGNKRVIKFLSYFLHGRVALKHGLVRGRCDIKTHRGVFCAIIIQATCPRACALKHSVSYAIYLLLILDRS